MSLQAFRVLGAPVVSNAVEHLSRDYTAVPDEYICQKPSLKKACTQVEEFLTQMPEMKQALADAENQRGPDAAAIIYYR